ncbi:MAG: thymidylate synthase [Methanobacterium sp.]|nr:thymidylate synthase [Methanobacterium sp.]
MFTLETALVQDAWKSILKEIMYNGEDVEDERNLHTKELLNVVVTILDPINSKPPEGYFSSSEKYKKIEKQLLETDNHVDGINYGKRIKEHFGFKLGRNIYSVKIDQIESVVNRLKKAKTSRRATLTVFDPSIDQYIDDVPSMIMVDYKIRKNQLYTTAIWRSHDIYGSWIQNFFGVKGLSKYIAKCLNIKLGPIIIHSISAHIYKTNYKDVEKIII